MADTADMATPTPSTSDTVSAIMASNMSVEMKTYVVRVVSGVTPGFFEAVMAGGTLSNDGESVCFYNEEGVLHRTDGPAVMHKNGLSRFLVYGNEMWTTMSDKGWAGRIDRLVRFGGTLSPDGKTVCFYDEDGKLHRDGCVPAVYTQGGHEYWKHGELHNVKGPAVTEGDGTRKYYVNNKLHRKDAPAIMRVNGIDDYYTEGEHVYTTMGFKEWEEKAETIVRTVSGAHWGGTKGEADWCHIFGDRIKYRTGKVEYRIGGTLTGRLHRIEGPAVIRPWGEDSYHINGVLMWANTKTLTCACPYHTWPQNMINTYTGSDAGVIYKTGVKLYFSEGVYTHSNAPNFVVQHNLKTYTPPCMKK